MVFRCRPTVSARLFRDLPGTKTASPLACWQSMSAVLPNFQRSKRLARYLPPSLATTRPIGPSNNASGALGQIGQAALIGLWRPAEVVFQQIEKLHSQRFCHGDLELHNVVVCTGPIQAFLMDFESSDRAFSGQETIWKRRRSRDLFELLRLAIYFQCGLGRQQGRLARKSLEDLLKLFDYASTFSGSSGCGRSQCSDRFRIENRFLRLRENYR